MTSFLLCYILSDAKDPSFFHQKKLGKRDGTATRRPLSNFMIQKLIDLTQTLHLTTISLLRLIIL